MPAFEFGAKKGSKHKSKDSVPSTSKRQNTQAAILSHLEEDVDDEQNGSSKYFCIIIVMNVGICLFQANVTP